MKSGIFFLPSSLNNIAFCYWEHFLRRLAALNCIVACALPGAASAAAFTSFENCVK